MHYFESCFLFFSKDEKMSEYSPTTSWLSDCCLHCTIVLPELCRCNYDSKTQKIMYSLFETFKLFVLEWKIRMQRHDISHASIHLSLEWYPKWSSIGKAELRVRWRRDGDRQVELRRIEERNQRASLPHFLPAIVSLDISNKWRSKMGREIRFKSHSIWRVLWCETQNTQCKITKKNVRFIGPRWPHLSPGSAAQDHLLQAVIIEWRKWCSWGQI